MAREQQRHDLASLLRRCGQLKLIDQGKLLHSKLARCGLDRETFLGNILVQMYGQCGNIEEASRAFERIAERNVFSWNMMLTAFTANGDLLNAWKLFEAAPKKDVVSWTSMLVGFAQNGYIAQAKTLFDKMPEKDLVAWNAMIAAYAQNGEVLEAVLLFRRLNLEGFKANELTLITVLEACSEKNAKMIHCSIRHETSLVQSLKVGNALINLYAKNGHVKAAMQVFEEMMVRDVISWTALMAAFNQSGDCKQALNVFRRMELEGILATSVSLIEVLNSCATTAALRHGRQLHLRAVSVGWFSHIEVRNAVLNMYGKCGDLNSARAVFDDCKRDLISWNTMISCYAQNGAVHEAVKLLEVMVLEGVDPDGVTVVNVISACSHGGVAAQGLKWICSICVDFGVESTTEQWNCVADLLGRLGCVEEARECVEGDEEVGVRTVLGACKVQGELKLAADNVRNSPAAANNSPFYVLLANLNSDMTS